MTKEISGVLTALPTPFDTSGEIDIPMLKTMVDRSINAGVDVLVAGGGTGEFMSLSDTERRLVFDVVIEHSGGRVPVVAHTGSITTTKAIDLSRAAERSGADVLMLVSPYYEPLTMEETTRYIKAVASSVEIPIMLYNNPGATGLNMNAETLAGFGRDVENIQYVKDSSKDWEQALRLIHHHKDDIGLIMGWDSYIFSALLEGATGVMAGAANVIPDEIVSVCQAIRAGQVNEAREQWMRIYPIIDAMLATPFTQAVKTCLHLQGESIGPPREPLMELPQDDVKRLETALAGLRN